MLEPSKYELHRTTIHPAVSISLSFLTVSAFGLLVGDALPFLRQSVFYYLLLMAVCFEESIVGNILDEEQAGFLARLREFLIVNLLVYVVLATFRSGSLLRRFYPTIQSVYPVILTMTAWLAAASTHRRLRSREHFIRATEEKTGEDLDRVIRELTPFTAGTLADMRRIRAAGAGLLSLLTLALMLAWAAGSEVRLVSGLAFIAASVDYFAISVLLTAFSDEYLYLGDGLRLRRVEIRRKMIIGGLVIVAAVVFASIIASSSSPLSLSLFTRFFNWLSSVFPNRELGEGLELFPTPDQMRNLEALRELDELLKDQEPSWFWIAVFRTIRAFLVAAAAVGLLAMLVGPFLTDEFAERLWQARPLAALLSRIDRMLRWLKRFFRLLFRWLRHVDLRALARRTSTKRRPAVVIEEERERHGRWKRRQISRICARFMEVIEWSTKRGQSYRKSFAPQEYGRKLGAAFPTMQGDVDTIVSVFEEVLYSNHVVRRTRMREFDRAVNRVVKSN